MSQMEKLTKDTHKVEPKTTTEKKQGNPARSTYTAPTLLSFESIGRSPELFRCLQTTIACGCGDCKN